MELVGRLRTAGAVAPRPEFTAELRHRLLEQAAARAATTTPTVVPSRPDSPDEPPPREDDDASVTEIRHRHGRRIRLVASTAALVLLGGGIGSAAAAQQAMPGDTLYGMKRSIENVSTQVSVGDDSRGRRDLEHAMTRLSEIRALVGSGGGDVATINGTLDDFSAQARKGVSRLVASYQQDGDVSSITAVTTFITGARQAIGELAPKLPPESLKAAVEALATIEQLAQHTTVACPKCEKPTPAKGANQPNSVNPGTEPSTPIKGGPSPAATTKPSTGTAPSTVPSTSTKTGDPTIVEQPTTKPTDLKTPPKPSSTPSATPSVPLPSLPTPSTTSWPWPFPTLSLPLPAINLPGVVQTLLPPWK
ncbi:DUF5667 domain-containing protein [Kribbella sancticallisti]|uniref:DUF5667 domain-containing protein n=1 Tax=Kribbella sancticallisti TaxID=460087 RepID=UPI0031E1424B